MARLLITGGAGFIGSHTCVVLLEAGHELVVLDNFANSSPVALDRVAELAARPVQLVEGDVRDAVLLNQLFTDASASGDPFEAVIHFAGLKAVGESVFEPLRYWDVNLCGTRSVLAAMDNHDCRTFVFSSTSTVYGEAETFPITETNPTAPIHPYAQTKLAVEQLLTALNRKGCWRVASLRYFNPVGAHPSGRIGEDPVRHPQQSRPVHHTGRCRPAQITTRVRQQLPNTRWHRHSRLPACDGFGGSPYSSSGTSAQNGYADIAHPQHRNRKGSKRARCRERI